MIAGKKAAIVIAGIVAGLAILFIGIAIGSRNNPTQQWPDKCSFSDGTVVLTANSSVCDRLTLAND
jgi:hypothetical protein